MRTTLLTLLTAATAAAALSVPAVASADPSAGGPTAVALVGDDKLVRVDLAEGGKTRGGPRVSGLVGDDGLVGIDHRPQDGALYGVGDEGGLYRLDARSGRATQVGQLTVPLVGTAFGLDFNPAANALRVISDEGQNLRQPFASVVDADPAQAPTAVDGELNRGGVRAEGVTGAAYINNDAVTTAVAPAPETALYDLDTELDVVSLQSPPNAGTLSRQSPLGVDTSEVVGFDVVSRLDEAGRAVDNTAYAVLTVAGRAGLYQVRLTAGETPAAVLLGLLDRDVTDLAVVLP